MTDTLAIFADQVTTVAREVGVEGRLGGQANVPGASGTWKDLTGNVNLLAANLDYAGARHRGSGDGGDQGRPHALHPGRRARRGGRAQGQHQHDDRQFAPDHGAQYEQDWLKTNLAKFINMLQGQRDLVTVGRMLLSELAPQVAANNGAIYLVDTETPPMLRLLAVYADAGGEGAHPIVLRMGEGLVGQSALDARALLITDVPANVTPIRSGLYEMTPSNLIILPVLFEGQVKAVIELASVSPFTQLQKTFLDQLTAGIGIVLNSIEATMQTEGL